MSHYAKVKDGIVVQVIVADADFIESFTEPDSGEWIQTSYNTMGGIHYDSENKPSVDQTKALRKNYAGIGYSYDPDRDAFIPPKPYPSWTLNEDTCLWEAPVAMPDGQYLWNEDSGTWEELS